MTRLCIHSKAHNTSLLPTQAVNHTTLKSVVQLLAYIDLYNVTLNIESTEKLHTPIYDIQYSESLLSPILFDKKVQIDDRSFPTVDNIEEHLIKFYGQNYIHPNISWQ